jgi:hypothetical protein
VDNFEILGKIHHYDVKFFHKLDDKNLNNKFASLVFNRKLKFNKK